MTQDPKAEKKWTRLRREMVDRQLRTRGIRSDRVLDAIMAVPRHRFLPAERRHEAYEDRALPIASGQTISQPYIVAYMTEQLAAAPSHSVLEIGTGTGYQTAVLARLCRHIHTIERIASLQEQAKVTLAEVGIDNVTYVIGDGSVGVPDHAPFDRIIVTAGAPQVPEPLVAQLSDGGRMIVPVGGSNEQTIVSVVRDRGRTVKTPLLACRFVKLVGAKGWSPSSD